MDRAPSSGFNIETQSGNMELNLVKTRDLDSGTSRLSRCFVFSRQKIN